MKEFDAKAILHKRQSVDKAKVLPALLNIDSEISQRLLPIPAAEVKIR